jgi:hypothetical protein
MDRDEGFTSASLHFARYKHFNKFSAALLTPHLEVYCIKKGS